MPSGKLYLVPTPIGNLEDITFRAVKILKECDLVACEDTRHTLKLLNHYDIHKKLISFFTFNQNRRIPEIVRELKANKNIALVSDSGTPGISDPGYYLIEAVIGEGIQVVPLPGPSALITALVGSGLPTEDFIFLGFLKRKPGKMKKELKEAAELEKTIIFYESPHRIKKTLESCLEAFAPETKVVVARELTKKHEEIIRGTLTEVAQVIAERNVLGEIVVLLRTVPST